MRDSRRCFECVWAVPDHHGGSGAVCRVFDKPLTVRELWRKVCSQFEPMDLPEEAETSL